jgi:hypothetical protein
MLDLTTPFCIVMAVNAANYLLNELLMVVFPYGMAGCGWASVMSQVIFGCDQDLLRALSVPLSLITTHTRGMLSLSHRQGLAHAAQEWMNAACRASPVLPSACLCHTFCSGCCFCVCSTWAPCCSLRSYIADGTSLGSQRHWRVLKTGSLSSETCSTRQAQQAAAATAPWWRKRQAAKAGDRLRRGAATVRRRSRSGTRKQAGPNGAAVRRRHVSTVLAAGSHPVAAGNPRERSASTSRHSSSSSQSRTVSMPGSTCAAAAAPRGDGATGSARWATQQQQRRSGVRLMP